LYKATWQAGRRPSDPGGHLLLFSRADFRAETLSGFAGGHVYFSEEVTTAVRNERKTSSQPSRYSEQGVTMIDFVKWFRKTFRVDARWTMLMTEAEWSAERS
jgi:hypothetical protein